MAQPTNTFDTYDSIGNREDLSDVIYNVAPTETPFLSMASKTKATAILHEWQTDTLTAVADNKVIDGDDATHDAVTATVRLNNRTQISDKVVVISGTTEAVNRAGRSKEMAYQLALKAKELKRDLEHGMVGLNRAKVAGSATVARASATVSSWIATNDSFGTSGASPTGDGTDARTDGTQRAFTEDLLKDVLQLVWTEGGDPDCIMLGAFNKRVMSTFTGGATRFDKSEDKKLYAAIDVYVSDFGEIDIYPNRFIRARDALVLQKDMWAIAYLRPFQSWDLAKTGDTQKKQLLVEWSLEARNEKSSGGIFDLTTS